ncbi:MAG TPA: hypothetical protein VMR45_05035 [Patescibacteria group bacterium]|nr:hypothetical protein [Patescibacteria group bacterium]
MKQLRLTVLLLLPSLFSGWFCIVASSGLLLYTNWMHISHEGIFYDLVFGTNGLNELQRTSGNLITIIEKVFNASAMYYILVAVVAMAAGGITYMLFEGAYRARINAMRTVRELEGIRMTHAPAIRHETITRLIARIGISFVGSVYIVVLIKLVLPFCITNFGVGVQKVHTWEGSFYIACSILLLSLGLHALIIFFRLLALRPRIFSNLTALQGTHLFK